MQRLKKENWWAKGLRITSFNYFDKSLIVLFLVSHIITMASSATFIGTPVGIASPRFSLAFSVSPEVAKKLSKK